MPSKKSESASNSEAQTPDNIIDKNGKDVASPDNSKAILCWIFAPVVGFFFLNDSDKELVWNAKMSMYFGFVSLAMYIFTSIASILLCCPVIFWALIDTVIRIIGAVKASQGERFEIPVLNDFVK